MSATSPLVKLGRMSGLIGFVLALLPNTVLHLPLSPFHLVVLTLVLGAIVPQLCYVGAQVMSRRQLGETNALVFASDPWPVILVTSIAMTALAIVQSGPAGTTSTWHGLPFAIVSTMLLVYHSRLRASLWQQHAAPESA